MYVGECFIMREINTAHFSAVLLHLLQEGNFTGKEILDDKLYERTKVHKIQQPWY